MASEGSLGTVLITGGCGYLGTELVGAFVADPVFSSIHVMSRNPTQNLNPKVNYHVGDISKSDQVTTVFQKVQPNIVIHCAAATLEQPAKTQWISNVTGTEVLLKVSASSPYVKAFVATSSESVMIPPSGAINEEEAQLYDKNSKINPYCITKMLAEKAVIAANDPPNLLTTALRMPILYGGDDNFSIGGTLKGIAKGQHKIQVGPDNRLFEWLYVEKAAESHILAAKALIAEANFGNFTSPKKVNGEAFLISDESPVHLFKFNRKVCAFAGHPVPENEIRIVPFAVVNAITVATEWFLWIFTLGWKEPEMSAVRLSWVNRGSQWKIDKAKERLGYVPADQDAVLESAVLYNAKRLGI